jgi:hypothetical protein
MAQDIRYDWSGGAVTVTATAFAAALADGAAATSDSVDLGAQSPFALALMARFSCTSSATANGTVDVYMQWSNDDSVFNDRINREFVGIVAGGTATQFINSKIISIPVVARYFKIEVENNLGAALATATNTLVFLPLAVDQA